MSVVDLESLSNDNLKKLIGDLVSLEDWSDECGACRHPSLLQKDGPCTRQKREPLHVVNKIWSELRRRIKPILATLKQDFRKEVEQSVLLDGITRLINEISGQNVINMNKYMENMKMLVSSFKDTFKKDEVSSAMDAGVPARGRISKLT